MSTLNPLTNISNLSQNTFAIVFARQPKFTYNVQRVDFPGVVLGTAQVFLPAPYNHDFSVPGEKLQYDPLTLSIIMDEDMTTYETMYNWVKSCAVAKGKGLQPGERLKDMTDGTLIMQSNKFNGNIKFIFEDIFPTNLGAMTFDYSQGPETPIFFDVTFNYRTFNMERIAK